MQHFFNVVLFIFKFVNNIIRGEFNLKRTKEDVWKILNSYGIKTDEDLKKALKSVELDIGIFTTPINKTR